MIRLPKVSLRLVRENPEFEPYTVHTSEHVEPLLEWMKDLPEENVVAIHLDAVKRATGITVVSIGTVSKAVFTARDVYKGALLANAAWVIVAHNHPSGSNAISVQDREATVALVKAGVLLDCPLLDHFVVGSRVTSIRQHHPNLWQS